MKNHVFREFKTESKLIRQVSGMCITCSGGETDSKSYKNARILLSGNVPLWYLEGYLRPMIPSALYHAHQVIPGSEVSEGTMERVGSGIRPGCALIG